MEFVFLAALVGIVYLLAMALRFYQSRAAVGRFWHALSRRLGVPMSDMTFSDNTRAYIPLEKGGLDVIRPSTFLSSEHGSSNQFVLNVEYKRIRIPGWFEYRTSSHVGRRASSSEAVLKCGGVDLSQHVGVVFHALFQKQLDAVRALGELDTVVRRGHVVFSGSYNKSASALDVSKYIDVFVRGAQAIEHHLPKDLSSALIKILARSEESALTDMIVKRLKVNRGSPHEAPLRQLVPMLSPDVLVSWCEGGLLRVVQSEPVSDQVRRDAFAIWNKRATLAQRAGRSAESRALVAYFCAGETVESLSIKQLASKKRVALPLMRHLFKEHPQDVWEASKGLMSLLDSEEARFWIEHLEASEHPPSPEHFIHAYMEQPADPSQAQNMLAIMRRVAASSPQI